jgi:hypothetical protein
MDNQAMELQRVGKFVAFDAYVPYERAMSFNLNNKNRVYNMRHLEKIKTQTLRSTELMPAITVNTVTGNIIDGQHRHKAYTDLYGLNLIPRNATIKVMYVEIPEEMELEAIVSANTNSKNWTLDDYISSYIKLGIESYVKLDEWSKSHLLTCECGKSKIRYASAILAGKRCNNALKSGLFTLTDEDFERANIVHDEMFEIAEILGMKSRGPWIESFAVSWTKVRNQHHIDEWLKEFQAKKTTYSRMPTDNSHDWEALFAQVHLNIDKKRK